MVPAASADAAAACPDDADRVRPDAVAAPAAECEPAEKAADEAHPVSAVAPNRRAAAGLQAEVAETAGLDGPCPAFRAGPGP